MELESPNIIGKPEGSEAALRDQYVVYAAHVDHLGLCPPIQGDKVCHGALDNASGTATLLEIAPAFTSLRQAPRRSVLFAFVTGEEMGLLGSDYFAHFPTVPRDKIIAAVNIDGAPGLLFSGKNVAALGGEHASLAKDVELATRQIGYRLIPDPMPEEVFFIRSDQYSFVRQGVPSIFIAILGDSIDVLRKWLTTKYHTPLDNMNQPFDYESGARGSAINFLVGYEVAQQDHPPAWRVRQGPPAAAIPSATESRKAAPDGRFPISPTVCHPCIKALQGHAGEGIVVRARCSPANQVTQYWVETKRPAILGHASGTEGAVTELAR